MPSLIVDTAVVVSVGPLVDDTDFKSLETAIAYNATGMSVDLFKSDGATVTKVDLTLTTGGANDWTAKGNGVYELEISAAQNDTEGELWVVGKCDGVLVFESPHYNVVTANVYNSLVAGSDNLEVDMLQIAGVTASATKISASASVIFQGTVDDTAVAPTTTTFEADDITETTADFFIGRVVIFTSGALFGQAAEIVDYAINGGRGAFTVQTKITGGALTSAPANNVTFVIV